MFDFQHLLGLRLRRIGRDFTYGEAQMHVLELMKEPRSHLSMLQRGLKFAASQADEALVMLATGYLNVHRDRTSHPQPFEIPHPWNLDPNADVTAEQRADLEARLDAVSAFPGLT